ncbi:YtzI protein [Bacillus changyiensis]|nr:YtzI protein [Bacillus changyiensis]MDA1477719.1 YtzI protein [Bacillus changyiensis]
MIFWIVLAILIFGAVLMISLVTTSKAYSYKHQIDPLPKRRHMKKEQSHQ